MNGAIIEYRVSPSIASGEVHYRLEGDALLVDRLKRGERKSYPLPEVVQVRLTCIKGVGRCELHTRSGDKVVILSRHFRGFTDWVDQVADYTRFVEALHERLAVVASGARYLAGTSFGFALGVGAVSFGLAGSVFLALAPGPGGLSGALRMAAPLLGTIAFALPLAAAGRARPYDPKELPKDHLPR